MCGDYTILVHSTVLANCGSPYIESMMSTRYISERRIIDLRQTFDIGICVRVLEFVYQGYYRLSGRACLDLDPPTQFKNFPDDFLGYESDDRSPERELALHLEMYRAGDYLDLQDLCTEARVRFTKALAVYPLFHQPEDLSTQSDIQCFFIGFPLGSIVRTIYRNPVLRNSPLRSALLLQVRLHQEHCSWCKYEDGLFLDDLRGRLHNKLLRRLERDITKSFFCEGDEDDVDPFVCRACYEEREPFIKSIWLPPCRCNKKPKDKGSGWLCDQVDCRKMYLKHAFCQDCGGPLKYSVKHTVRTMDWDSDWCHEYCLNTSDDPDWIRAFEV